MFDWFEIQWQRFNIWLDNRREWPGYRITVTFDQSARCFRVHRERFVKGAKAVERDRQARLDAGEEKQRRLNPFITPAELAEWRAKQEEKHAENLRKMRERAGVD